MTTPAVVYVNPDLTTRTVAEQIADCLSTAERLALDLRYWIHDPLDAPPIVRDGRACGLVIAAHDVITPTLLLDAVTAQIELAGGRVYVPTSRRHVYEPEMGVMMAARLHRRGFADEQIADVLETTPEGVQALLAQAARRGLLGVIPLTMAWMHHRAGKAALIAVTAVTVITGVEWVERPGITAIPPSVQSPAPPGRPGPSSPQPSPSSPSPTAVPSSSPAASASPTPSPSPSRSRLLPRLPRPSVPVCLPRVLPAPVDLPRCVDDLLPTG